MDERRARLAAVAARGRQSQGADRELGLRLRSRAAAVALSRGRCADRRARCAAEARGARRGRHLRAVSHRLGAAARLRASTATARSVSHDNLALDPRKLTAGLLNAAAGRGARLYAPVEATAFEHSADGVEVATADGRRSPRDMWCWRRATSCGHRAGARPPGHLDLGDRDQAAEGAALAGRGVHLGGVGPVSLSAHHR